MAVTINGTTGITTPEVALDNSAADGGQVVLKSSGYGTWNLDNYSGRLRGYYNSTEYFTVDASGNMGIGVTPSAWGGSYKAIDILYGSIANTQSGSVDVSITQNAYYNGTNWITKYTGASKRYSISDSGHIWYNGASATAGTAITLTEAMRIDSSGNVLVTSAAGLGYGTGSGGTVTQATSKSTAVTLNKPTGTITMNAAALAANTNVTFQFNNSVIAANDIVVTNLQYSANYQVWSYTTGAGYAYMVLRNISGGSLSEAVVFSFAVIKGATS